MAFYGTMSLCPEIQCPQKYVSPPFVIVTLNGVMNVSISDYRVYLLCQRHQVAIFVSCYNTNLNHILYVCIQLSCYIICFKTVSVLHFYAFTCCYTRCLMSNSKFFTYLSHLLHSHLLSKKSSEKMTSFH